MKKCSKCNVEKDVSSFYNHPLTKDGKQSWCKECKNKSSRYWNTENKDTVTKTQEKYRIKNKNKYAFWQRTREASKNNRTPKWLSKEQLNSIKLEYELAAWCSSVMGEIYHVDHIVPLQGKTVSGLHVPWNLQVIPAKDNIRKSNKYG